MKLASELQRRQTGKTFYILDEPTTGLHFDDVRQLLEVLQRLVDAGNTVLVIEHNLDIIKAADYVVDLGPEGRRSRWHHRGVRHARGNRRGARKPHGSFLGSYLRPERRRPRRSWLAWRNRVLDEESVT